MVGKRQLVIGMLWGTVGIVLQAMLGAGLVFGQIQGSFEVIGSVPKKHSLEVVVVEEFLNFTCPHCNNFRNSAKSVFEKYGSRIQRKNQPILFRGQPDHPLRLYFIAQRAGRAAEIKEMIFDASFKYGVNIYDPKVVGYLARSAGLFKEFQKDGQADWVTAKILESHKLADRYGIEATPTLVLNGTLRLVPRTGMQEFINNFDTLVQQMLKPAS